MTQRRMNVIVRPCLAAKVGKRAIHTGHMYHLKREATEDRTCPFWSYFWCEGYESVQEEQVST